jgi:hypothetical protein
MKSKKIVFIPKNEYVPSYAPSPEPSSSNIPSWWRKQGPYQDNEKKVVNGQYNETVKRCPGVQDILFSGYILKTPCDIFVDTTGDRIVYEVNEYHRTSIAMHPSSQISEWDFDKERYMSDAFRIHPMWIVKTDPGYSTLFIQPPYHEGLPFRMVTAIVDTDKYPSDGAFSMLFEKGFKGVIPKGTPLIQCIPYKRETWKMEVLDKPDVRLLRGIAYTIRSQFGDSYKRLLWEKKVFK